MTSTFSKILRLHCPRTVGSRNSSGRLLCRLRPRGGIDRWQHALHLGTHVARPERAGHAAAPVFHSAHARAIAASGSYG